MAQSQNAIREIFVVDVLAGETTMKTFVATASEGEVGIFNADGSDGSSVEGGFQIAMIVNGKAVISDTYLAADVAKAKSLAYAAPALRAITFTPTNVTVGQEYALNIRIMNFGSLSVENYYTKHAQYVVKTGDAAAQITAGLKASLNKNFSREEGSTATTNTAFTFVDGATLVVTEKDQPYDLGRDEGRAIQFDITVDTDSVGDSMGGVVVTEGGTPGVGTGKQVAQMEYFYRGNRGDGFGKQHFPYNWSTDTKTRAVGSNLYALVELQAVSKDNSEFNISTSRKELTIAMPVVVGVTGTDAANAIINKLELVINQTLTALVDF